MGIGELGFYLFLGGLVLTSVSLLIYVLIEAGQPFGVLVGVLGVLAGGMMMLIAAFSQQQT